jgi:hypothetical protein
MLGGLSRKPISTLQTLSFLIDNSELSEKYFLQGNNQT